MVTKQLKIFIPSLLLIFILLISFQNCSYQGNLVLIDSKEFNFSSQDGSGSGNGSVYEGKLTIVLKYKDQVISNNLISMFSGENFQFNISGGTPPYNFNLVGNGFLDPIQRVYTAVYSSASETNSTLEIKDSLGAQAEVQINVRSFTLNSKLNYPAQNTTTAVELNSVISANNGVMLSLVKYTDHQKNSISFLRKSINGGKDWIELKEFNGHGSLLSNDSLNIYFFDEQSNKQNNYFSNDSGSTWSNIKSPVINGDVKKYLLAPTGELYATAVEYNDTLAIVSSDSKMTWKVYKSINSGQTWITLDSFNYLNYNMRPHDIFLQNNSTLWVIGSGNQVGLSETGFIRKGNLTLNAWSTEYTYTSQSGFRFGSIAKDSFGNLFFSGIGLINSYVSNGIVFKYNESTNIWSIVKSTSGLGAVNQSNIFTTANDELYFYYMTNSTNGASSHQVIEKSTDSGSSWVTITSIDRNSKSNFIPENIQSYSGKLIGTSYDQAKTYTQLTYLESLNGGATWEEISNIKPISKNGGNFYVNDMVLIDNETFISIGDSDSSLPSFNDLGWNVLKTTDSGNSWNSVDTLPFRSIQPNKATSIIKTSNNDIYVVGQSHNATFNNIFYTKASWAVRKSSDLGKTWSTVDIFSPEITFTFGSSATSITEDKEENLYVLGVLNLFSKFEKNIRKSSDHGKTWVTVDTIKNFVYGTPTKIKYCGNKSIITIGKGVLFKDQNNSLPDIDDSIAAVRWSRDSGDSWKNLYFNFKNETKVIYNVSEVFCDQKGEITLFVTNELFNLGQYATLNSKLMIIQSLDYGQTWKLIEPSFNSIIPLTVEKINDHYWIGGYKPILTQINIGMKDVGIKNWSIVKSDLKFSVMAEIDKPEIDKSIDEEVRKVIHCGEYICVIGNKGIFKKLKLN